MGVKTNLSIDNLTPMNTYGVDPMGMLYTDGEDVIRILTPSSLDLLLEYEEKGIIKELIKQELILPYYKTFVFENGKKHLSLVFEFMRVIPSDQWTIQMFIDAGSHLVKINQVLRENGFGLLDANTSNLTFKNSKPILIDTGSLFGTDKNIKTLLRSFYHSFIIPINLHLRGDVFAFYKYINTFQYPNSFLVPVGSIEKSEHYYNHLDRDVKIKLGVEKGIKRVISFKVPYRLRYAAVFLSSYFKRFKLEFQYPELDDLTPKLTNFKEVQVNTQWKNYHSDYDRSQSRFPRIKNILIKHGVKINEMLDLAGNQGEFSAYMVESNFVENALVIDYDHESLNIGFKKYSKLKGIDFVWANPFADNKIKLLSSRYKSEAVFALAVTHHLILSQKINLDFLVHTLVSYTKEYLVVEFMPKGLYDGNSDVNVPSFYTLSWFKEVLEKYVCIIDIQEIADNRVLYVTRARKDE